MAPTAIIYLLVGTFFALPGCGISLKLKALSASAPHSAFYGLFNIMHRSEAINGIPPIYYLRRDNIAIETHIRNVGFYQKLWLSSDLHVDKKTVFKQL